MYRFCAFFFLMPGLLAAQLPGTYTLLPNLYSIKVFADGSYALAGELSNLAPNDLDPGPGTLELQYNNGQTFVAYYTADNEVQWAYQFGGSTATYFAGMEVDEKNIYLLGEFLPGTLDVNPTSATQNITNPEPIGGRLRYFLVSLERNGSFNWGRDIPGYALGLGNSGIAAHEMMAITDDGQLLFTGRYNDTTSFDGITLQPASPVLEEIFIASADTGTGNFAWAKRLGFESTDFSFSSATAFPTGLAHYDGNLLISGYYDVSPSANGGFDFDPDNLSTLYKSVSISGPDGFLALYDGSNGNFISAVQYVGDGDDHPVRLNVFGDHIYTVLRVGSPDLIVPNLGTNISYTNGNQLILHISDSALSNLISYTQYNGLETMSTIANGPNSSMLLLGGFADSNFDVDFSANTSIINRTSVAGTNAFITNYDPVSFSLLWTRQTENDAAGGGTHNGSYAFEADANSNLVRIVGSHNGLVDFYPGPASFLLNNADNKYSFVWTLDAQGNITTRSNPAIGTADAWQVWPNPTNRVLNVANMPTQPTQLQLLNAQGQKLWTHTAQGKTSLQVTLPPLAAGLYSLVLLPENGQPSQRSLLVP